MPKSIGHPHRCDCARCIKRREQTRINVQNFRARQQLAKGVKKPTKRASKVKSDDEEFFWAYLGRHREMDGLTAYDLKMQRARQNKKCIFTDQTLNLRHDLHMEAAVVLKNDQLDTWNKDNVRLVSVYAVRFVIDPGDGRTLDAIAEERKGLEQ